MEIVSVEGVTKQYSLGSEIVTALAGVTITINAGERVALAGPSGSGKTTLLNLIGCVESPTTGSVTVDGETITSCTSNRVANIRAERLGFVFQTFNLLPVLTALENVTYPLYLARMSNAERRARAEAALNSVGLSHVLHHRPNQLSGGQRQRVAIARAIVRTPKLLVADEPTANLDRKTGQEILDLLHSLSERSGSTLVISTHDPEVMAMSQRIIRLRDGKVEEGQ